MYFRNSLTKSHSTVRPIFRGQITSPTKINKLHSENTAINRDPYRAVSTRGIIDIGQLGQAGPGLGQGRYVFGQLLRFHNTVTGRQLVPLNLLCAIFRKCFAFRVVKRRGSLWSIRIKLSQVKRGPGAPTFLSCLPRFYIRPRNILRPRRSSFGPVIPVAALENSECMQILGPRTKGLGFKVCEASSGSFLT